MPICKRSIEPVDISRKEVVKGVSDELECVSNNTMVHVILQLSSLSKLAEDLFSELHVETCQLFYRTCKVFQQVEVLKHTIVRLNPIAEEVSLHDINQCKPHKSADEKDQQVISIVTRPELIKELYDRIDPPPSLHLFDPYREDGRRSIKFYTDPDYFFELWTQEVAKDARNQMIKQKGKLKRRPTKEFDSPSERSARSNADGQNLPGDVQRKHPEEAILAVQSNHFVDNQAGLSMRSPQSQYEQPGILNWSPHALQGADGLSSNRQFQDEARNLGYRAVGSNPAAHVPSVDQTSDPNRSHPHQSPLDASFPSPPRFNYSPNDTMNDSSYFPPPPPPHHLEAEDPFDPPRNPNLEGGGFHFSDGVEDLLSMIEGDPARGPASKNDSASRGTEIAFPANIPPASLKSPADVAASPPNVRSTSKVGRRASTDHEISSDPLNASHQRIVRDTRSDLLEAIRTGIQLRKVEEKRMITEKRSTVRFDVQSIMEAAFELRRKVMEGNGSEEEDDVDNAGWSDDT